MLLMNLLNQFLMKDQFNKNLVVTEEEEHLFQQSNNC